MEPDIYKLAMTLKSPQEVFLANVGNYSNHLPLLWLALEASGTGPILELGTGWGSTPYLHVYAAANSRPLLSADNSQEWVDKFVQYDDSNHRVKCYSPNWSDADFYDQDWSVVLIDHAPGERRVEDLLRFKNRAKFIVIHDTELPQASQYIQVWPLFRYKVDVRGPNEGAMATAVSDTYDLHAWRGRKLAGCEVV